MSSGVQFSKQKHTVYPDCLSETSCRFCYRGDIMSSKCAIGYLCRARTPRRPARIFDVPRTPVRSLRRALEPTINITDIVRAGLHRNLYFVPSQFGTNPCDRRDHLSRHLVGDRDQADLSQPLVPRTGSVRIIRPVDTPHPGLYSALGASSSPREHLFSAWYAGICPSPAIARRR